MECSHRELCRYDWLSSQGFATICDVNCCPLQVIFEFVYCWNPLNPQITGGWKECNCHCAAATVEFQSFCWSLIFSCSQHDDLSSFSDLFPTDCFSFIPSSHYFPFGSRQGIWVKFPSSESVSEKRPAAFSLKPGDGSSITPLHLFLH